VGLRLPQPFSMMTVMGPEVVPECLVLVALVQQPRSTPDNPRRSLVAPGHDLLLGEAGSRCSRTTQGRVCRGNRARRGASGVDAPDLALQRGGTQPGRQRRGAGLLANAGLLILDVSASKGSTRSPKSILRDKPLQLKQRAVHQAVGDPAGAAHARTSRAGGRHLDLLVGVHSVAARLTAPSTSTMWQRCPGWPDWMDAPEQPGAASLIAGFLAQLADARRHRSSPALITPPGSRARSHRCRSETAHEDKAAVRVSARTFTQSGAETTITLVRSPPGIAEADPFRSRTRVEAISQARCPPSAAGCTIGSSAKKRRH